MKLATSVNDVDVSTDSKPCGYTIKASAKAFEILSSGLYSNKIKAVVRELSTNAYDAHVAAGKGKEPFTIHLPTMLEPFYSIRDYGTGIAEADIYKVYTTYFESTRSDSNEFAGCLGLGSKSPFSYTDQFVVTSIFNGKKLVFNCFVDERNIPNIVKLGETETNEVNGVEIHFPVKSNDFHKFREEVINVLSRFETKPKVNADISWKKYEYIYSNNEYGLCKDSRGYSCVIMGNVEYPLDTNLVRCDWKLANRGLDIFVPLGAVEMSASRESLSYNKITIAYLNNLLDKIPEQIKQEMTKEIQSIPTIWQARKRLSELLEILGCSIDDIRWNNKIIKAFIYTDKLADARNTVCCRLSYRGSGYSLKVIETNNRIVACDTPVFINDLATGHLLRIKEYLANERNNGSRIREVFLINSEVQNRSKDYTETLADTGVLEVAIPTSTLPKKTVVKDSSGQVVQRQKRIKFLEYNSANNEWVKAEHDPSKGGIFIEILRFTPTNKMLIDFYSLKRNAETVTGQKITLYGIRPIDREWLEQQGNWLEFETYLKNIIDNNKKLSTQVQFCLLATAKSFDSSLLDSFGACQFRPNSVFGKHIQLMKKIKETQKNAKVQAFHYIQAQIKPACYEQRHPKHVQLTKLHNVVFQKYPLLGAQHYYCGNKKDFVQYIKVIDLVTKVAKKRKLSV